MVAMACNCGKRQPFKLSVELSSSAALQRSEELLMKQKGKSDARWRRNRATMKNAGGV
jgi:hypothetical protein